MNVPPLIKALEAVEQAVEFTPEPNERAEIKGVAFKLRTILQKRGVFIGQSKPINERKEGG